MRRLDLGGQIALVRQESRGIEVDIIGQQTLHPQRSVSPRFGFDVQPDTSLQIQPRADRGAPQGLQVKRLQVASKSALARRLYDQAIERTAHGGLQVPQVTILAAQPRFQPVDVQHGGGHIAAHLDCHLCPRRSHRLSAPQRIGGMNRAG